jgi:hypothetical protein
MNFLNVTAQSTSNRVKLVEVWVSLVLRARQFVKYPDSAFRPIDEYDIGRQPDSDSDHITELLFVSDLMHRR